MTPTVTLVGASGYGRHHLADLLSWHRAGLITLGSVVDVHPAAELPDLFAAAAASPLVTTDLGEAIEHARADTVVIASPPHTHAVLARRALSAGAAVYLEKPPVPLPAQLRELIALAGATRFEVGFQQTPGVVAAVAAARAEHDLGPIVRVTGFGAVQRPDRYYARATWAGRRELDGVPVFDGSLFNPFAHVVHAALAVARAVEPQWTMAGLEAELGSVRPIQADDVAALRVTSEAGPLVTAVATTAADRVVHPSLLVEGRRGSLRLRLRDLSGVARSTPLPPREHPSVLRRAVLDPRGPADPLLTAAAAEPFVRLVGATVDAVDAPTRLGHLGRTRERDGDRWAELPGITDAVEAAVASGTLLSEQQVPIGPAARRTGLNGWNGLLRPPYDADRIVHQEVST